MEKLKYLVPLKTFHFLSITIKATGTNWVSCGCVPATTATVPVMTTDEYRRRHVLL